MQQRYNKLPLLFLAILMAGTSLAGCKKKDMSLKLNEPRNIKGVISYRRTFGDLNEAHLNVAQTIGITPIASRKEAEHMKEKLQYIETNDLYVVDSLTHSIPYLIKGAAQLLDTIGTNFLDSLTAKGLNPNKIIVTSVLRTEDDVKLLAELDKAERSGLREHSAVQNGPLGINFLSYAHRLARAVVDGFKAQ